MSISPQDMGDQWQGLEPEQPRASRGAFWVALLAFLLLLGGAAALGIFLLNQDGAAVEIDPVPGGPDDNNGVVEIAPTAAASPQPTLSATSAPDLAPTVTLPAPPSSGTEVRAQAVTQPITIDANLGELAGLPAYPSPHIVYASDEWDGSDDLEANWQLAWDSQFLYLAVMVLDDVHVQTQTDNTIFRGDSLELQIDTDRAADFGPELSTDDYQISLSPGDFVSLPPSAFLFQGTGDGDMRDAPSGHSIRVGALQWPQGYVLEAAVPWSDLGITPTVGLEIGLALNANDNDQPGTAVQEVMKSNTAGRTFRDPTTWGTLVLE